MASGRRPKYMQKGFWHKIKNQFWHFEGSLYSKESKEKLDAWVRTLPKEEELKG